MDTQTSNYFVIQNMGAVDRILRTIVGGLMLGVPFVALSQPGAEMVWWYIGSMTLSTYPLLTALCGFDPIYKSLHAKSCTLEGRHQCGSFPYEVDALLGHKPIPEDHLAHELSHSSHKKAT